VLLLNDCKLQIEIIIFKFFTKLKISKIYLSTLYGSLCLIYRVDDLNTLSSNYNNILTWISVSFNWLILKSYTVQANNESNEIAQNELKCVNAVLNKMFMIFNKDKIILNDMVTYLSEICRQGIVLFKKYL
jgi:hypothetical protein